MTTIAKKNDSTPFPRAKITRAIEGILPNGNFEIRVADSRIGKMKIVRIVTPAWKSLRPAARISKVLRAVSSELTPEEEGRILRFSVLTPDEYKRVVEDGPVSPRRASLRTTAEKRAPASLADRG